MSEEKKARKAGRPTGWARQFTDEEIKLVYKYAAAGNTVEQIADFLDTTRGTFYQGCKRQEELLEHYNRGIAKAITEQGYTMYRRGLKDGSEGYAANKFWLETRAAAFRKKEEQQALNNTPRDPITINFVQKTDE